MEVSINFTPEAISLVVGFVLTLLFAYFPGLRTWYAALKSEVKSYIMLGLLLLAEAIILVLAHYGVIVPAEPITMQRIITVALALLVANQPTYTLLPEVEDVKVVRLLRDYDLLRAIRNK